MFEFGVDYLEHSWVIFVEDIEDNGYVKGYIEYDGVIEDNTREDICMIKSVLNCDLMLLNDIIDLNMKRFEIAVEKYDKKEKEKFRDSF